MTEVDQLRVSNCTILRKTGYLTKFSYRLDIKQRKTPSERWPSQDNSAARSTNPDPLNKADTVEAEVAAMTTTMVASDERNTTGMVEAARAADSMAEVVSLVTRR